jgi:DNA transformation protein and related proteins
MATERSTVDAILRCAASAGDVSARAMFGEYALYLDGKLVALICDDALFVKLTAAGQAIAADAELASPYPGAKPILAIKKSRWENGEWLAGLLLATAAGLPMPKPKRRKS